MSLILRGCCRLLQRATLLNTQTDGNAAQAAQQALPQRGHAAPLLRATLPLGMRQALQGSFSAVSKPNFAIKFSFESSRRDLHNTILCTALQSHFFFSKFSNFNFAKMLLKFVDILLILPEFCYILTKFRRNFTKICQIVRPASVTAEKLWDPRKNPTLAAISRQPLADRGGPTQYGLIS